MPKARRVWSIKIILLRKVPQKLDEGKIPFVDAKAKAHELYEAD